MTLVIGLTISLTQTASAAHPLCADLFSISAPMGNLTPLDRESDGSTGGKWFVDENGINWFIKKDVHYSELQTSAEPIAAQIYQHFGYRTTTTVKLIDKNGVHFSASQDIGYDHTPTLFSDRDTSEIRQMRIVAAYLKDWDRLGNPSNNRNMSDGSMVILDFGGTLGSRAQGHHKPGVIFSDAIGCFEATTDINTIYTSFVVMAPSNHPWTRVTRTDAKAVIQKFRNLTDEKIESIVASAGYTQEADRNYMVKALKLRRDGIILHLLDLFPEIDG